MLTSYLKTISLILTLAAAQVFVTPVVFAGTKDGNGGNAQVAEFYSMAKSFHQEIKKVYKEKDPSFPMGDLTSVMARLVVEADPGPLTLKNGDKVDAINNPNTAIIYLDDASWAKRDGTLKYQIVIHELLGLLRIQDFQYGKSKKLAALTKSDVATAVAPGSKLRSGSFGRSGGSTIFCADSASVHGSSERLLSVNYSDGAAQLYTCSGFLCTNDVNSLRLTIIDSDHFAWEQLVYPFLRCTYSHK